MNGHRTAAMAALGAALGFLPMLHISPAYAAPSPGFCVPATVVDGVCTARLAAVTADNINGTITGTPVGGGVAITLAGQADAYLKSEGFGATPPDPIQQWDASIDRVSNLDTTGPDWYGNAKSMAFLPRSLDELATQFPADTIVVRFGPDDAQSGAFPLVSIQPMAH